jgi:protein-disulfide isomerase
MADIVKSAEKEIVKEEKKIGKFFKKTNTWIGISCVLFILLVVVFVMNFGMTKGAAGNKLVNFLNTEVVQGGGVTLSSVEAKGSLYQVKVLYQGKEIPVYITKDGKYFVQGASEISPSDSSSITGQAVADTPTEVPKSDKPAVDLWVFSYCPYGTQAEKGLIPVYNLLKNKADINIKYIGAMHGEYEKTESLRQLCIQKNYGQDKFMSYIMKLDTNASVGSCGSNEACSKPIAENIMKGLGIDVNKINTCMTKDAEALYSAQEQEAASLGISGSPTLVVNGVETSSGRSAAALLATICSAFNNAPSECSQKLDSASPSPGFGATASESANAAQCG